MLHTVDLCVLPWPAYACTGPYSPMPVREMADTWSGEGMPVRGMASHAPHSTKCLPFPWPAAATPAHLHAVMLSRWTSSLQQQPSMQQSWRGAGDITHCSKHLLSLLPAAAASVAAGASRGAGGAQRGPRGDASPRASTLHQRSGDGHRAWLLRVPARDAG